jgi:hypothetical protein
MLLRGKEYLKLLKRLYLHNLVWISLRLINRDAFHRPLCGLLSVNSSADEHVGDVTIPTQVIEYDQFFSRRINQSD